MNIEISSQSVQQATDPELEKQLALLKSGEHPWLLEKLGSLQRAKENKLAAADRHRKMMIKNINQLYEYEVQDAQALYNKAYEEIQERLASELVANHQRIMEKQKAAEEALAAASMLAMHGQTSKDIDSSEAGASSQHTSASNGAGAAAGSGGGGGGRSLRSTAQIPNADKDKKSGEEDDGTNGWSNGVKVQQQLNGRNNGSGSSSSSGGASRRKSVLPGPNGIGIDCALPESAMRADFVEIVRDLHSRAAAYELSKPKSADVKVRLTGDLTELIIGEDDAEDEDGDSYGNNGVTHTNHNGSSSCKSGCTSFSTGDLVVVFSVLSQENISGLITSLSHREIVIRTGTGARFSVLVGQIRSGRVTLSKDKETIENAHIFNAAAEIDELMNRYHR